MSAALHLAGPEDANVLLPIIESFHAEEGFDTTPEHRAAALAPLLEGTPLGCVYLIGPRRAPIGYIAISFGWSLELGGMDSFIDEFYIRSGVRGRGVGGEVLDGLLPQLEAAGVKAIHLEASADNPRLDRLYSKARFKRRDGYVLMTRTAKR